MDEPTGKNNGMVNDVSYFSCPDKHGLFVRASQATVIADDAAESKKPKSKLEGKHYLFSH